MKRVLIIDDTEFARMMLREMLEKNGYEVCGEASDGLEGFNMFKELRPDLTLCDIRMSKMNGYDCIRHIIAEDKDAKVLVCAAINAEEKIDNALKLGAKGVIRKPINANECIEMIEKTLDGTLGSGKYKDIMERCATKAGIGINSLLDFYSAFNSINGFALDDPRVDRNFLIQNSDNMLIGMRALLSAKISLEQINTLEKIFLDLTNEPF